MKRVIVVLGVTLLLLAMLIGLGSSAYADAGGEPANPNLTVLAGELQAYSGWSIDPCVYQYRHPGVERVTTTIDNPTEGTAWFDMGYASSTLIIPPESSITYEYKIHLTGDIIVLNITNLGTLEELPLKLEPDWEKK
jgi:hypothetical protein